MEKYVLHPVLPKMHFSEGAKSIFLYVPRELKTDFPNESQAVILQPDTAEFILGFFYKQSDLEQDIDSMKQALKRNGYLWIAFPKGHQMETDLSRDILREDLVRHGLSVVSVVSIDAIWSAVRLKPSI